CDFAQRAELAIGESFGINVELVSGEVVEHILKRKVNVYHICFETDQPLQRELASLKSRGFLQFTSIKSTVLWPGKSVAFLYHKHVGIIEILGAADPPTCEIANS